MGSGQDIERQQSTRFDANSSFGFVEAGWFQALVATVIALNVVMVVLYTMNHGSFAVTVIDSPTAASQPQF